VSRDNLDEKGILTLIAARHCRAAQSENIEPGSDIEDVGHDVTNQAPESLATKSTEATSQSFT
jgi:hypothetical protein